MTYPFGTADGNVQMDFQRANLGGVRANFNGIVSSKNGPTVSQSVSSSGNQSISLQNVVRRVFEPQFRNLQDLEQTVDKQQAESLRLLRISQRERHKAVSAPVEYFYRSILIPKLAWSILLQFIYAVVLLGIWTPVAKLIDVFYIHTHLRTQNTFFEDFKSLFSMHTVINWRNCFGALLLAGAATWHYVQFVRIPPPVFVRKEEKLKSVIKMMVLSGPWILVYVGLMCLRPDLPLAVEKLIEHNADTAVEVELLEEYTGHGSAIAHLSEIFIWDIFLRVLAPFIFLSALILAVEIVRFWKGEYCIGALRGGSTNIPWWKRFVGNPISTISAAKSSMVGFSKERLISVLSLPGPAFVIVLSSLFFLPILFPVGLLFRIWMYYHCLSFVIIRVWDFGLDTTKNSLAIAHNFFSLNFFDIVALPPVLKDLRRMNWAWLPYFELQTVNGIHDCFRFQPSILKEFLTVKLSTRDMNQLASFVQFWITPLREFASQLRKRNNSPTTAHNGAGPFMNIIWGAMSYLMKVAAVYDYRINSECFAELYDDALKASRVKSSLYCIDDVLVLSELLVSGNVWDEKGILVQYYDSTIEALATVAVASKSVERYGQGAIENDFLNDPVDPEPTVRFYIKSFSQLQTIAPLHLRELLKLADAKSYDLRISDPECSMYIEQLRRENLS